MIGLPSSVSIFLFNQPVSMRNGPDGLARLVRKHFAVSVFSGHLFVFLSKRRDRVKILFWELGGFVVYYKRLEKGRFRRPELNATGQIQMTGAELTALLEGIDLTGAKRTKLWYPAQPTRQPAQDMSQVPPHGPPTRTSLPVAPTL